MAELDLECLLYRDEAADHLTEKLRLKTSKLTLQKLASVGGGPQYRLYGGRAVYDPADLASYASAKLSAPRRSTAQAA